MISELMQSPVKVVSRFETLAHARNVMLKENLSRLVVVEGSCPIGTITRRDIINGLNNYKMRQRELNAIVVEELMRSPVITLRERESVEEAARKMIEQNIKGLPVVDTKGELVGIVTKTDLTRYFAENDKGKFKISDLCQAKGSLPVVHPTHSVSRVVELMHERYLDRVTVVDGDKPVGVITETDLSSIRLPRTAEPFHRGGARGNERAPESYSHTRIYCVPTAEDIMTRDPLTIGETKDAALGADMLIRNGIGGLPVVDKDGALAGLVTKFDFVRIIAQGA